MKISKIFERLKMITINDVKKRYAGGRKDFWALDGVSLEIGENEFVAITGKSGSGKSTLLNMIDSITSGSIIVDGKNISKFSGRKIAEYRNKTVGFVFQSFYLEPSYSVYDNVELPLVLSGKTGKKNRAHVVAALEAVGLGDRLKEKARNLSGGEQQRVAIARAIVNDPRYILADEPCGNLDSANSENIMHILKNLHAGGKTVIMVTHDPEDARKAERIVTMSDGKVIGDVRSV